MKDNTAKNTEPATLPAPATPKPKARRITDADALPLCPIRSVQCTSLAACAACIRRNALFGTVYITDPAARSPASGCGCPRITTFRTEHECPLSPNAALETMILDPTSLE